MAHAEIDIPFQLTPEAGAECRCCCGSLLARRVEAGIEIKCRGCKRLVVLPFEDPAEASARSAPR